jgi:phosphatidylserine/phosphatidylglycerophosphate/cardiolipin synthase-like enzyme
MSAPRRTAISANALPTEGMRVGRESILVDFLELCGAFRRGLFFFTAPFFDESFVDKLVSQVSVAQSEFEIVVRDSAAARQILDCFRRRGCRSVSVSIARDLHAKVYVFEAGARNLFGLIGSHNATAAGMKTNLEVGIYIGGRIGRAEWKTLFELREFLRKCSQPYLETGTTDAPHRENQNDNRRCIN